MNTRREYAERSRGHGINTSRKGKQTRILIAVSLRPRHCRIPALCLEKNVSFAVSARPCCSAIASSRIHSRSGKDFLHRLRGCYLHSHGYILLARICTSGGGQARYPAAYICVQPGITGVYTCVREEPTSLSLSASLCARISRNTRSSNPLLETRLIPRIAICL